MTVTKMLVTPNPFGIADETFKQQMRTAREVCAHIMGSWAYHAYSPLYKTGAVAIPFEELAVGMELVLEKTISECDVFYFMCLSGDCNPIHMPNGYRAPIAHGMVVESAISRGLSLLPGPGTLFGDKYVKYCEPVYVGDTITMRMRITELKRSPPPKFHRLRVEATWHNQKDELVIEGWAHAFVPNLAKTGSVVPFTRAV